MKLSLKLSLELSLKNINKLSLELSLELGVVHLVPAGTRNHALTVPADAAAPPESRRRCRLDVGTRLADRERSWSFPRSRHRRRSVGTTTPEESGEGQWPGFGLRWSVDFLRLIVAAQQWCGGYHPSQSVVTAPGRRHRHPSQPRGLGRSPGIPSVYPPSG